MKVEFLCREEENTRLILVFAGWGADAAVASGVRMSGWDVAVAYDFIDFTLDTTFLERYYTVYLFAWSLGVYAAAVTLPPDRITAAFAINGTLAPVDDALGIPQEIFRGTADSLDARNLLKFRMRMMSGRSHWEENRHRFADCGEEAYIESLRAQLYNVMEFSLRDIPRKDLPWVRAYIGTEDRIFPAANQRRAWECDPEVEIVETEGPHYADIAAIARGVIADPARVSARFSKASVTYDTHAIAQYSAAIKLAGMLAEKHPAEGGRILEVGCGTGLFTREYGRLLRPSEATFVDITHTGPFNIAMRERYVVDDAEMWIETQRETWDVILSASCIQWFADIPRFLHNCSARLGRGGILALSTFLPGNMEELDAFRPSPMIYPKAERLRAWLEPYFEDIEIREDCIRVEFRSVREMLMHLKHTGVGGSAPSNGLKVSDMSDMHSLTYRPVYITARNKG